MQHEIFLGCQYSHANSKTPQKLDVAGIMAAQVGRATKKTAAGGECAASANGSGRDAAAGGGDAWGRLRRLFSNYKIFRRLLIECHWAKRKHNLGGHGSLIEFYLDQHYQSSTMPS
jgi:hypothetical protein